MSAGLDVTVPIPDRIASRLEALADEADRIAYRLGWILDEESRLTTEWVEAALADDPALRDAGHWNRHDPTLGRLQAALNRIGRLVHEDDRFERPVEAPTGPTFDWWVSALGKMASELAEGNQNWAAMLAARRAGG